MMTTVKDQPPPISRPDATPVWDEVIRDVERRHLTVASLSVPTNPMVAAVLTDMRERDQVGRERYGTPLTTHNGRDHVVDAYQELLDAAVYMKAAIIEDGSVPPTMYTRILDDLVYLRAIVDARTKSKLVGDK